MPTKLRTAVRRSLSPLAGKNTGVGITTEGKVFYCPSCSTWRRRTVSTVTNSYRARNPAGFRHVFHDNNTPKINAATRRYLTVSAPTRLNSSASLVVDKSVPARFRELYAALKELEDVAADHISLSRLQLVQRGLESEEPVVRVAVLGVNNARTTRRLVRLLLADPLTERQSWEDLIDSYGIEGSNGLLIRYGEESGIVENNLCPTISINSPLLKQGRIELFVSTLGPGQEPDTGPITDEVFFVPTITVQSMESGGHELIRYPVHKTIIFGTGTEGLLAYSGLLGRAAWKSSEKLVHGVIELGVEGDRQKDGAVTFVNTEVAETALDKFRESVRFASEYERGWTAGGVQSVADWLPTAFTKSGLSSELQTIIESLLDAAEEGVTVEEVRRGKELALTDTSAETRRSLDQSVSIWAERAHTELRNALDEGFASQRWNGLSWWKLFWRVDDVGSVTSEILQTRYLPRSEKEMIWTAGRVEQTGLLDGASDTPNLAEPSPVKDTEQPESDTPPWPLQIATSRLHMLKTTVPSLQALSQGLVLFSASTAGLTSALSALLYTSASTGLYEACTIAAVGLMYSLRRQQVKWENARAVWQAEVREQGRTALIETEQVLRRLIRDGPSLPRDESAERRAKMVIARARKALEDVREK
ncbi:conserved hypothetical protein [Talaromyces stipitatus ATCC 10500]|uniref:Mmc1 C-terminal domain-containing protein n=1 Tax=Talaromyces stipitatus (strain ATCC 10500 / CBS 375.48 / QM 6759 / NRRL 1006) TaxID=441959 RepID=B8M9T1_TALSN|nr:uncharacterized protein TSTA_118500 [Talaromyces stipitatus ATCC 10500]EED18083.1 conserved hypothetical protein [Talaromyces stipitatus ATCC 10500]